MPQGANAALNCHPDVSRVGSMEVDVPAGGIDKNELDGGEDVSGAIQTAPFAWIEAGDVPQGAGRWPGISV
jgi:hypothetical protein